jgi:uncharacterized Zn-finger protein
MSQSDEKKFKCDFSDCNYKAKTKYNLNMHFKQVHTDDKPFLCSFQDCDFKSKTKTNLKLHITQVHTKITPFLCSFQDCSYKCHSKANLEKHIQRKHSVIRPFCCSTKNCDYKAKTKEDLNNHVKTHSDSKSFLCTVQDCNANFTLKKYLKRHIEEVHSDTKSFSCSVQDCAFKCNSKSNLDKHIKGFHVKNKGKPQKKKENLTSDILKSLNFSFGREFSIKFSKNKFCKIDFFAIVNDVVFLIENDERQHKYNDLSEEIDRMLKANTKLNNQSKRVFIRYNPDTFYIGKKRILKKQLSEQDRVKRVFDLITNIANQKDSLPELSCYYCFYDVNEQGQPKIFENPDFDNDFKKLCSCIY